MIVILILVSYEILSYRIFNRLVLHYIFPIIFGNNERKTARYKKRIYFSNYGNINSFLRRIAVIVII